MRAERRAVGGEPSLEVEIDLDLIPFRLEVSLRLGEATAIVGPSGAGKTSLLEAIAGLRPARGRIVVAGEVVQERSGGRFLPPERRRLGYVPQEGALFPHLTVRRNLLFGRRGGSGTGAGSASATAAAELRDLVAALELEALLDRFPRHLSGGEQRRVAVGRALLSAPRLLLLDEPTVGLDAERARKVLGGILRARERAAIPLLVVTHRHEEAAALADEIVLLERGRVVGRGPARELFARAPAAERHGNVTRGRVVRHDAVGGVTEVALANGALVTIPLDPDLAAGREVALAIDAEELLVATVRPRGLSARNAVEGRIDELIERGPSIYARVGEWHALLTASAVRELELEPGREVWLIAKTHGWRVIAE